MKKILSIPLIILILFSGISIKFATHYCGGYVAATKVSLTGELATCGMENTSDSHSLDVTLTRHCCDDSIASYTIDNNYTPSFSFVTEYYQFLLQDFTVPNSISAISYEVLKSIYTNVSPPGALMSTSVDISAICVYRI